MVEQRSRLVLALGLAGLAAAAGGAVVVQLTRMLWSVLNQSYAETHRLMVSITAQIQSDNPDDVVPDELQLVDEDAGLYAYGQLQELFFRRSDGPTDWEWSPDSEEWHSTDDIEVDDFLLDPPSLIFILRLHLSSVVRRKTLAAEDAAIAAGLAAVPAAAAALAATRRGDASQRRQQVPRIPPPLKLPAWAEQQQEQQTRPAPLGDSLQQQGSAERHINDAPEALCCPITGQIMLQPVITPCGKTFEYGAVKRWISQNGKDPHSLTPLSLHQLYPNLIVREMVERWLATGVAVAADGTAAGAGGSSSHTSSSLSTLMQQQQVQQHLQQALREQGSEDPLSSFGESGSSSSSSSSGGSNAGERGDGSLRW